MPDNSKNVIPVLGLILFFSFLFCSRNASELKAADILMITVILHNIFPHSKQAIPLTLNRTPPPLAHPVVRKGGPSVSHRIISGPLSQGVSSMQGETSRTSAHSDPVDIDTSSCKYASVDAEDLGCTGSSVEDEFYSPRSSPTPFSLVDGGESASQDVPKSSKEHFFTPRAPTPEYLRKLVKNMSCEVNEITVNSLLTDTSIRRTPLLGRHLVLVPAIFQSFYCNCTLYNIDTFLIQTMDTFETINGRLRIVLCSEKYLKTEV